MDPKPEIIRAGYVGARRLQGKHCLITVGDSGIGRAVPCISPPKAPQTTGPSPRSIRHGRRCACQHSGA